MKRSLFLAYGVAGHLMFLATYAYLAGFVGNAPLPKTIDSAKPGPVALAVVVNLLLLLLFCVQHSVMARPAFKRVWTRVVPQPIERSTYVLAACAAAVLLMWQWRTIDAMVWDVRTPVWRSILWGLFGFGWLIVPVITLLLNHCDLFGTRQVWLYWRGREYEALPFRVPALYQRVRHPLYLGFTLAFWATPTMTFGHLLFAGVLTGYMAAAAVVEERDLVAHFGRPYEDYQQRVPMFVPRLRALSPATPDSMARADRNVSV